MENSEFLDELQKSLASFEDAISTDEKDLFELLSKTKAGFILSAWHHNDYRKNENIEKYWNKFNIITKDHFYFAGEKEENRNPVVEALIYNYQPACLTNSVQRMRCD